MHLNGISIAFWNKSEYVTSSCSWKVPSMSHQQTYRRVCTIWLPKSRMPNAEMTPFTVREKRGNYGKEVGYLVLKAQSIQKDYIRAEGGFQEEIYSWKDQWGRNETGRTVRKQRAVGRIYGMKSGWKGHEDRNRHKNKIKRSGQARLVYVENIGGSRAWV